MFSISCIWRWDRASIVLPHCENNRCRGEKRMCRWLKIQKESTANSRVSTFAPRPFLNARCVVPDARVWGRRFPPVSWFFSFFSSALQRSVPAALLLCVTLRATAWHRAQADSTTLRDSLPAYNQPNGSGRCLLAEDKKPGHHYKQQQQRWTKTWWLKGFCINVSDKTCKKKKKKKLLSPPLLLPTLPLLGPTPLSVLYYHHYHYYYRHYLYYYYHPTTNTTSSWKYEYLLYHFATTSGAPLAAIECRLIVLSWWLHSTSDAANRVNT